MEIVETAKKILEIKKGKNISYPMMAKRLGKSPSTIRETITRMEKGKDIGIKNLAEICKSIGIELKDVI